jgi:zinc transport system ATP-binding protein
MSTITNMNDRPPVVELRNVSFGFPPAGLSTPVLEDVSLRIEQDDFLGVIGPNGGGKTTLLRIILGLLRPQRGSVSVLGQSPSDARRQIGYVPQHARIDDSVPASVLDVVLTGRLGRSRWGWRYGAGDKRAAIEALKQTQTDDLAARPFGALSGGQRQRVLIARALVCDAKLLLLDEPTAGVDVHMESGLVELLCELNKRLPIVMVSHDISVVSSRLKRVACLSRTMTSHDASEVTQEIIGHMYHSHGPMAVVHHDDESCPVHDHSHDEGHAE